MDLSHERFLIVHPFGIGDVLFMTPVIRSLHEAGAESVDLLLGSRTRELFELNPFIKRIHVFNKAEFDSCNIFQRIKMSALFYQQLKQGRYTCMIDLSLIRFYNFLGFLLGIRKRVSFDYKNRGLFLTHRIKSEKAYSDKHVAEYYADLLRLLNIPIKAARFDLFFSSEDEHKTALILESRRVRQNALLICASPGGGESWGVHARLKRWPVGFFAEFLKKLKNLDHGNISQIVILGSAAERVLGEELRSMLDVDAVNLCGELTLRQTSALLKKAGFLIGNDGGLIHMASAFELPTVALFGPVDPKVYGPYPPSPALIAVTQDGPECRPCYQNMRYNASCDHVSCLTTLEPSVVFERAEKSGIIKRIKDSIALCKTRA